MVLVTPWLMSSRTGLQIVSLAMTFDKSFFQPVFTTHIVLHGQTGILRLWMCACPFGVVHHQIQQIINHLHVLKRIGSIWAIAMFLTMYNYVLYNCVISAMKMFKSPWKLSHSQLPRPMVRFERSAAATRRRECRGKSWVIVYMYICVYVCIYNR